MAKTILSARGINAERLEAFTVYRGPRRLLMAAGVCEPGQFPRPGRLHWDNFDTAPAASRFVTVKREAGDRFAVRVWH